MHGSHTDLCPRTVVISKCRRVILDGYTYEGDKVSLNGLLKSADGRALEAEVGLEILGDLTDETLEGELSDEELS